jgi:Flp pilus assembly protein TadD
MLRRREEALSAVEAVLRANPTHREAGLLAATILNDLGRPAEAVDRLRLPVAGDPEDRDLLFAFGASLERAGEVDSSLAVFDRLLAANPDDDEALNHAGYICIDRGIRVEAGLDRVRRALERAPDNGAYLDSYGWGLFRLGRAEEALDWLRRAAEKAPKEAEIRLHQGEVLEALDRPDDARAAYREALRLRPGDPEIRRRLDDLGRRPARQPAPGVPASN